MIIQYQYYSIKQNIKSDLYISHFRIIENIFKRAKLYFNRLKG